MFSIFLDKQGCWNYLSAGVNPFMQRQRDGISALNHLTATCQKEMIQLSTRGDKWSLESLDSNTE